MRAYSSRAFARPSRGGCWKWILTALVLGGAGGFVVGTAVNVRQPVELTISTPSRTETTAEITPSTESWSGSANISVRTPKPNSLVVSPFVVEGLERTFEQKVVVRLKDSQDQELVKVSVTGTAPDLGIYGPYRAELIFEKPTTKTGTLEVFQISPKDGSEIDIVRVPIRFE